MLGRVVLCCLQGEAKRQQAAATAARSRVNLPGITGALLPYLFLMGGFGADIYDSDSDEDPYYGGGG